MNRKAIYIARVPAIITMAFFIGLISSTLVSSASARKAVFQKKAEIAWTLERDNRYDLGYSYHDGTGWQPTMILSTGNPVNFTPALAKKGNGDTWMVWSADTGDSYRLYYAVISADNTIEGPLQIKTGLQSNTAPDLMIDGSGVSWITWAGNNGDDDDIYFSRYNGSNWEKASLVHADNTVSDVFPRFVADNDNGVTIEWTSMDMTGGKIHSALLSGNVRKRTDPQQKGIPSQDQLQTSIKQCVSALPLTIVNYDMAVLQLNCAENTRTLYFSGKKLLEK